ncbi:MAG TPA: ABC transporter permease [Bryobacteraceae bacterium]|nr:ABC transporter permease [Bryobacteraceae bacterium]
MSFTPFFALARRDIRLFFLDRRAVLMSFLAPILIGSFFGYIFGGSPKDEPASKIEVAAVNQDTTGISGKIVSSLTSESAFHVKPMSADEARTAVRSGKITVALVIPPGFADRAVGAFLRGFGQPQIQLLYDPSHGPELQMVRGILTQHVIEVVSREAFSGTDSAKYLDEAMREVNAAPVMDPAERTAIRRLLTDIGGLNQQQRGSLQSPMRAGFTMPYSVKEEAITARAGTPYNGMAHAFAGMAVQFILFMGIDAGLVVLAQRQTGLWKRLQAAPISRFTVIASRAFSAAGISALILTVVFGFARAVFNVRVEGSFPGFLGVCLAFSLMTAAFGLLVAVLGKTPEATRGMAILITLLLVMLGGSWIPAFLFPAWLQKLSFMVPTRWAVDGLEGMLWRGLGWDAAVGPILALLGFALLFGAIAIWRFRWETE